MVGAVHMNMAAVVIMISSVGTQLVYYYNHDCYPN